MSQRSTTERNQRDSRLNIRTSTQQQQIIRSAAAALDKSVTEFVLESATTNAERVLAIPAGDPRAHGMAAREQSNAPPRASVTALTTFGFR